MATADIALTAIDNTTHIPKRYGIQVTRYFYKGTIYRGMLLHNGTVRDWACDEWGRRLVYESLADAKEAAEDIGDNLGRYDLEHGEYTTPTFLVAKTND